MTYDKCLPHLFHDTCSLFRSQEMLLIWHNDSCLQDSHSSIHTLNHSSNVLARFVLYFLIDVIVAYNPIKPLKYSFNLSYPPDIFYIYSDNSASDPLTLWLANYWIPKSYSLTSFLALVSLIMTLLPGYFPVAGNINLTPFLTLGFARNIMLHFYLVIISVCGLSSTL